MKKGSSGLVFQSLRKPAKSTTSTERKILKRYFVDDIFGTVKKTTGKILKSADQLHNDLELNCETSDNNGDPVFNDMAVNVTMNLMTR